MVTGARETSLSLRMFITGPHEAEGQLEFRNSMISMAGFFTILNTSGHAWNRY